LGNAQGRKLSTPGERAHFTQRERLAAGWGERKTPALGPVRENSEIAPKRARRNEKRPGGADRASGGKRGGRGGLRGGGDRGEGGDYGGVGAGGRGWERGEGVKWNKSWWEGERGGRPRDVSVGVGEMRGGGRG